MAKGPEALLVGRIVKALRHQWPGAFVVKVHGGMYQTAGLPDLLVVVDGCPIGMEVKARAPGESEAHARGRTTLRQQAQLDAITRAGGTADTVLSEVEALALVKRALAGTGGAKRVLN